MTVTTPVSTSSLFRSSSSPDRPDFCNTKRTKVTNVANFMVQSYRLNTVTIDPARHRTTCISTGSHRLSRRQIIGLALLATNYGHVLPRSLMHETLCQTPYGLREKSALAQHIRRIRSALGDDASNPRFIETVRDSGFVLLVQPRLVEVI